jgi:hypothetical protein
VGDQVLLEDGEIGTVVASLESEKNQDEEMGKKFSFEGMFRTSQHESRATNTTSSGKEGAWPSFQEFA